jgi:hypothetical protein
MDATDPLLQAKLLNAAEMTRAFIRFLEGAELGGWAERFKAVLAHLEAGDARAAIELQKKQSFAGPGSLSDLMLVEQEEYERFWGSQSKSLANLRLYLEYGFNRPLVVLENAGSNN